MVDFEGSEYLSKPIRGLVLEITQILSRKLRFNYSFQASLDKEYGRELNGSWTGFTGMLISGEADLVISDLTVTYKRLKVIDFSFPFFFDSYTFFTKTEPPLRKMKIFNVLQVETWLSSLLVTILMYILIRGCLNIYSKALGLVPKSYDVLNHFGTLLRQPEPGNAGCPHISYLTIGATWWFFVMLMSTAFSADMISYLNVMIPSENIETIKDFKEAIRDGHLEMAVRENTAFHTMLKTMPGEDDIFKTYFEKCSNCLTDSSNSSFEKLGKRLDAGKFVLPCERSFFPFYFEKRTKEVIHSAKDNFFSEYFAVGLPKGSDWMDPITNIILTLQATGLLNKWFEETLGKMQATRTWEKAPEIACISFQDFLVAWLAFGFTIPTGIFICILEICYAKKYKSSKNNYQIEENIMPGF